MKKKKQPKQAKHRTIYLLSTNDFHMETWVSLKTLSTPINQEAHHLYTALFFLQDSNWPN